MALRDRLAEEAADHAAIRAGIPGSRVGARPMDRDDELFGAQVAPVTGERVAKMEIARAAPDGIESLIANDPVFSERRAPLDRKPFGAMEQTLAWEPRAGYRRYWFNDTPGRITRAKEAGYTHVEDPSTREPVSRITDRADGRGRSSYLMEIPMAWYQQDMGVQAATLKARLDSIRYGKAGPGAEDGRYIPEVGIKITGR